VKPINDTNESSNTMTIFHVPENQWQAFLESFGQQHAGKAVCVEVLDASPSTSTEATVPLVADPRAAGHDVALRSIDVDKQSDGLTATVVTDGPADEAETESHAVRELRAVYLEQPGPTQGGSLRIDGSEPEAVILRFGEPIVPGLLDGMSREELKQI
jgi:hypothetical protein